MICMGQLFSNLNRETASPLLPFDSSSSLQSPALSDILICTDVRHQIFGRNVLPPSPHPSHPPRPPSHHSPFPPPPAAASQFDECELLLDAKASVDVRLLDGSTPLALAAQLGHAGILNLLLKVFLVSIYCFISRFFFNLVF